MQRFGFFLVLYQQASWPLGLSFLNCKMRGLDQRALGPIKFWHSEAQYWVWLHGSLLVQKALQDPACLRPPFWTAMASVWSSVSWWRGLINRPGDNRVRSGYFLLFWSTSFLGELNKTGQFCFDLLPSVHPSIHPSVLSFLPFIFFSFRVFIHTSSTDFASFTFTAGSSLPHSQNNTLYPGA